MITHPNLHFNLLQGNVSGAVQRGDLRPALEALRPGEEAQDIRGLGQEGLRHRPGTEMMS